MDPVRELERLLRRGTACPHAQLIYGVVAADAGVVCGVMVADGQRADRILEGAPVGEYLTLRDDPSMVLGFCLGDDPPANHPDETRGERIPRHHTCCPIYAAEREYAEAQREGRVFGELVTGDDRGPRDPVTGEPLLDAEPLTDPEVRWLSGEENARRGRTGMALAEGR